MSERFLKSNLYDNVLVSVSPQPGTAARPTEGPLGHLTESPQNCSALNSLTGSQIAYILPITLLHVQLALVTGPGPSFSLLPGPSFSLLPHNQVAL
jgi:hypothetical protein